MKLISLLALSLFFTFNVHSQNRIIIKSKNVNISEGRLKVVNEAKGIVPIFVSVLWYNDTTMLDIVPIAKTFGSYTDDNDVRIGNYYDFEFNSNEFNFLDKQIKPEHLIDLVSNYEFTIKKGLVTRRIPFVKRENDGKDAIPNYLSVTIEKIYLN